MNDWWSFALYCVIAFIGAWIHYVKKRYVDKTTEVSLREYLLCNKSATLKALGACIAVAYGYAISDAEVLAMSTVVGVFTGGYASDSGLNKVEEE